VGVWVGAAEGLEGAGVGEGVGEMKIHERAWPIATDRSVECSALR
jgi:hypothetical protein